MRAFIERILVISKYDFVDHLKAVYFLIEIHGNGIKNKFRIVIIRTEKE